MVLVFVQHSLRVVTLAQKEAVAAFMQMADAMLKSADAAIGQLLRGAKADDERKLGAARSVLRDEAVAVRLQLKASYENLLERAMRTMHTDLRSGLGDFRADTLSLIEDDVVTRAIEVDRLVVRLRDADQINLGHLNLIIAQLHGASDVAERENPFRPYLLARALHETLRQMVENADTATILQHHLASAMSAHLGHFYSRIREVFESQGVRTRLLARPSALNRYERDRLAWKRAADQIFGKVESGLDDPETDMRARMLPRVQRMLEIVQYQGAQAQNASTGPDQKPKQAKDLQELVWEVFHQPRNSRLPRRIPEQADRSKLKRHMGELQRAAAEANAFAPSEEPLALRDRLAQFAAPADRLTIDLVALLFEFIQHDEQLCAPMRQQLVRLHLPFLRAALLQPALLHDTSHPARRLLDRAGSLAVTLGCGTRLDAAMLREMGRLVTDILQRFDTDVALFAEAETALDNFYFEQLALHDASVAKAAAAFARADMSGPVLESMREILRELLEPFHADRRMIEFITQTWVQVLVHCHEQHADYRAMLAELMWSAQEKPGPEDRAILMRLLPDLGKRLRAGLSEIGMPEQQAKEALDKLVNVHMDVLANKRLRSNAVRLSQQVLYEEMRRFRPERLFAQARTEGRTGAGRDEIAASIAVEGLDVDFAPEPAQFEAKPEDADCLAWARPGTSFERWDGGNYLPLMLEVASAAGLAFLFRPKEGKPLVFTRAALLSAMRDGSLRPLEHARLYERAVESLMMGAESLAA